MLCFVPVLHGRVWYVCCYVRKKALLQCLCNYLLLLFAMIRSVVKSFKVPDVEVAAARMSNESALTHDLLDTKKTLVRLDAGPGWMS